MKVDLSICIISYNQSKYIEECLRSIIAQKTNYNVEIVLSDDCSQDDTVAKASNILKGADFKYTINVMEKNGGFQKNLKAALSMCSGRYIALCEADDYWLGNSRLDQQIEILDSNKNLTFSFSAAKSIDENGDFINYMRPSIGSKFYTPFELISKGSSLCPTFTIVFRSSSFKKITKQIYKQPVFDYPLQVLLAAQGPAYYFDEYFGVYRRNAIGSWTAAGSSSNKLIERYKASRDMHCFLLKSAGEKYKNNLNSLFFKGCLVFLRRNNIAFKDKLIELNSDRDRFGFLLIVAYSALVVYSIKNYILSFFINKC